MHHIEWLIHTGQWRHAELPALIDAWAPRFSHSWWQIHYFTALESPSSPHNIKHPGLQWYSLIYLLISFKLVAEIKRKIGACKYCWIKACLRKDSLLHILSQCGKGSLFFVDNHICRVLHDTHSGVVLSAEFTINLSVFNYTPPSHKLSTALHRSLPSDSQSPYQSGWRG